MAHHHRVCDIWRGYWVQRLLWEIDGNLVFGPPTVNQVTQPLLEFICPFSHVLQCLRTITHPSLARVVEKQILELGVLCGCIPAADTCTHFKRSAGKR